MSNQITLDRRWPARVFAVGLGFTLGFTFASDWPFSACGPLPAQRQICSTTWADLPHNHQSDSGGETYSGASEVWTMSGTSTATG